MQAPLLILLLLVGANAGPNHFNVDMDLPTTERWREVAEGNCETVIEVLGVYQNMVKGLEASHPGMIDEFLAAQHVDPELLEEVSAYEKYCIHPNVNMRNLQIMNMNYEIGDPGFCAGMIAEQPDGTVIHGRNLDLDWQFDLQGALIIVHFHKGGKEIAVAPTWPCLVGLHTGMRLDGWSFQQNTRSETGFNIETSLEGARHGGHAYMYEARKIIIEEPTYEGAMRRFNNTRWSAPNYFILAGKEPHQGVVVTGGRDETQNFAIPLNADEGRWYLVQTNDDLTGDPHDGRRGGGAFMLESDGQETLSEDTMLHNMRSTPMNVKGTVFTWVATPAENTYQVYLKREHLPSEKRNLLRGSRRDGSGHSDAL